MPPRGSNFVDRLGELFGVLQQAPGPVHVRVWQELGPWLRTLSVEAPIKWVQRLAANQPCHVIAAFNGAHERCRRAACAACMGCGGPVCLSHAFINAEGEAICYACASSTLRAGQRVDPDEAKRVARQKASELIWARRQLKVSASAEWETVRTAHRKLSAKWHPDRYRTEAEKSKAEAKFKELQRAFDLLQKEYERVAA